jgi:hypothetical protein
MYGYRPEPSFLRIVFPPPGFFIGDARVSLIVNGGLAWDGSFKSGFDWWTQLPPGWHTAVAMLGSPLGISRNRAYNLEVRPGLTTVAVLEYSRMWGNFDSAPARVDFVSR